MARKRGGSPVRAAEFQSAVESLVMQGYTRDKAMEIAYEQAIEAEERPPRGRDGRSGK